MQFYDASRVGLNHIPDKIRVIYDADLITDGEPDAERISENCAIHNGKRICIDVERWLYPYHPWDELGIRASMARYQEVIRLARLAAPDSNIGLYVGRIHTHGLIEHGEGAWLSFQRLATELAPLMDLMDTIYISAYAVHDKPEFWRFQMSAFILTMMQYQKTLIPFVWHRGAGSFYNGDEIGSAYWREILGFLESLAIVRRPIHQAYIGGVAVWIKSDEETPQGNAPWWVELQRFLSGPVLD